MFSSSASQVSTAATYIEDVFSTYLYNGNSSTQSIVTGINLATNGGLLWAKCRSDANDHRLYDTARGATVSLVSNLTDANSSSGLSSFDVNGFTLNSNTFSNLTGRTYAAWTFRKQAKFFDVVTYTGTGSVRTVSHNLGSTPGFIIIKKTSAADDWFCYHTSLGSNNVIWLDLTNASSAAPNMWNNTAPTSTVFTLGTDTGVNANGASYVAYLFAHNAGGFGAAGTDNVISCGSFTTDGSGNATVSLGYEPQFIINKPSSSIGNWDTFDVMRGWLGNTSGTNQKLNPNLANAEAGSNYVFVNSTGFSVIGATISTTFIYIAIRRGPMKTPTSGTSVFSPIAVNAVTGTKSTTGFPVDLQIFGVRSPLGSNGRVTDRLRGVSTNSTDSGTQSITSSTGAETTTNQPTLFWDNTGFQMPINYSSASDIFWSFGRAPGFFDQVCYTGTGAATTFTHNLAVAPELMIVKRRNATSTWRVYASGLTSADYALTLNTTAAESSLPTTWNSTAPTSTVFTVGTSTDTNASAGTYVNYLFATLAGVSKVGSYTGTGALLTVNCGFTSGARFVLIKSADAVGSWYVWDSARGISGSTDPFLLLNSTAAEDATTNYVDTTSVGFQVTAAASTTVNVSGGKYIFLAIA
jgi:hypothetical protein